MLTMKKTKKNKPPKQQLSPGVRTEKDADDQVHSQEEELPTEAGEEELDDLIHRPHKQQTDSMNKSKLEDPDDLAHRSLQEDEDNEQR